MLVSNLTNWSQLLFAFKKFSCTKEEQTPVQALWNFFHGLEIEHKRINYGSEAGCAAAAVS
jgi:hypothetical protein